MSQPEFERDDSPTFGIRDLFVGVTALVILFALFANLVRVSRDEQQKTVCLNNLRQIVLGSLNYESAHQHFPKGYNGPSDFESTLKAMGDSPSGYQFGGPLVAIAPFLESHCNDYPFRDVRNSKDAYWTSAEINQFQATWVFDCFNCPADNADGRRLVDRASQYSTFYLLSGDGRGLQMNDTGAAPMARHHRTTNYLACAGDYLPTKTDPEEWSQFEGVFVFDRETKFTEISDGSSQTLLFGEVPGAGTNSCFAWTCSPQVVHWNAKSFSNELFPDYRGAWWCFGSAHRNNLISWAFADGRVESMAKDIDPDLLRMLGGKSDSSLNQKQEF